MSLPLITNSLERRQKEMQTYNSGEQLSGHCNLSPFIK